VVDAAAAADYPWLTCSLMPQTRPDKPRMQRR